MAALITRSAEHYGVPVPLALGIAQAESSLDWTAKNASSTASGIYQFIDGTFRDFCIKKYQLVMTLERKNEPEVQIECAMRMIAAGGKQHWNASRSKWAKYDISQP